MEYLINLDEQDLIKKALEDFEDKSSAEIVTVIAQESDSYLYIPTIIAAFLAFIVPLLLPFGDLTSMIQLVLFMLLVMASRLKSIKMLVVPSYIKKKELPNWQIINLQSF